MNQITDNAKYPTNLASINTNPLNPLDAGKYFNNFFDIPIEVTSNINAAIVAYFEQITDNKESARVLASAVLYTSAKQGLNPMDTLDEFRKLVPGELDTYTAFFLNFERVGTSYLGVKNQPEVNKYVLRSIIV